MSKKKTVYDYSLIDHIQEKINQFNSFLKPKADGEEYLHRMKNPTGMSTPDNYSAWGDAFATWSRDRANVNKDSSLGDYILAEEELSVLQNAKKYIENKQELNSILSSLVNENIDKDLLKYIEDLKQSVFDTENDYIKSFDEILSKKSPNTYIQSTAGVSYITTPDNQQDYYAEDPLKQIDILNKQILNREDLLQLHLKDAAEYADIAEKWDKKIGDYYRYKSTLPGLDLTDIDTYVYKVPGLMGSSAATLGSTVLGLAGGALMAVPHPVTKLAGAAVMVGSNIYSRDNESSAEAYQTYKETVKGKAQTSGVYDKMIKNAKEQLEQTGEYTNELLTDDFVLDLILTGRVDALVEKLKNIQWESLLGAKSAYKDNMALSTVDVAQDILTIFPLGKLAKAAKTILPKKLLTGVDKVSGIKKQISDRIDDVVEYGLDGLDKLPRKKATKRLLDLSGRIVLTSALEGAEEGTQYMISENAQQDIYDTDAGLFNRWLHNVGRGARSLYAALTPYDPVYSNDEEFLENFKGGALLGGLMTGSVGGASLAYLTYDYNRKQYPVTKILSQMYADKLDATDRVRKNIAYSDYVRNNQWNRIENAFDDLEEAKIEGLDESVIEEERQRANTIKNQYTAPLNIALAESIGIKYGTDDYSIFIALKDHHDNLRKEAAEAYNSAQIETEQLINSPAVTDYINDLDIVKTGKTDSETVRRAILEQERLRKTNELIDRFASYAEATDVLQKRSNLRKSKSDIIEVGHVIEKNKEVHRLDYELNKDVLALNKLDGFNETMLSVPSIHQDLSNSIEILIGNELDMARANDEWQIMNSLEKDLIVGKIEKYKGNQEKEAELIQRLNDLYSGKINEVVADDAIEVTPPILEEDDSQKLQSPEVRVEKRKRKPIIVDFEKIKKESEEDVIQELVRREQQIANRKKEVEIAQNPPQTLFDVLGDVLGDSYTEALSNEQTTDDNTPVTDEAPLEKALKYDKNTDPYSHHVGYWMTSSRMENGFAVRESKSYRTASHLLNNEAFSEVTGNSDFYQNVKDNTTVEVYDTEINGNTIHDIYFNFNYNGKQYGAYVLTENGLKNNRQFSRLPYERQQIILQNLKEFREKILNLHKATKNNPNLKVVPTAIRLSNGKIINELNEDGTAKNKRLTESIFLTQKDPYKIDYNNTEVGISTGPIGGNYTRVGDRIVSIKNSDTMGKAVLRTKVRRDDGSYGDVSVSLNTANFKNSPELVELMLNLLTSKSNDVAFGDIHIPVSPQNMLRFLVNFGPHTATSSEDARLTSLQLEKRLSKQFYQSDETHFVIGNSIYTLDELLGSRRQEAKEYILNNFHWSIPEQNLNRNYFGGNSQFRAKVPGFEAMSSWFKLNNVDKITLSPGIEFTKEDFGINNPNPNGITSLGWYIKNGILLTNASNVMPDKNIYIDDVMLEDITAKKVIEQSIEEITDPVAEDKIYDLPGEGGTRNKFTWTQIQEILDGKKRKTADGPNMTIEHDAERIYINAEQAKQWLSDKLGISAEIVSNVIDVTEAGLDVVGRVYEDSVVLSESAPEGALYHEAWHRISLLLLGQKKRKNLYKKYLNKGMTEVQVEEYLAEQYRNFMLYADAKKDTLWKFDFDSKNLFRRIFDFTRMFLRIRNFNLTKVMYYASIGKYKGLTPKEENVKLLRKIYPSGVNMEVSGVKMKSITTEKQLDDITKSLLYAFFLTDFAEQTINYSQLAKIQPNFDKLKRLLHNTQATDASKVSPVMDEIVEKFDSVFAPRLKTKLKSLGIRAFDELQKDISGIEEASEEINIGQHTVEGMHISIKDNAPAEVKFFMQTIPEYEYNLQGQLVVRLHPHTGFAMFYDSAKSWSNVLKDLSGCRTINNILDRVARLAETELFYKSLLSRLTTLVTQSVSENERIAIHAEALLSKIETVITCDVNNYTTVKINTDEDGLRYHKIIDNGVDAKAMKYPKIWSLALFRNSDIFHYEDGKVVANQNAKQKLNALSNRITSLIKVFTERKGIASNGKITIDFHDPSAQHNLKLDLINILQSIGIGIDLETLNYILNSGAYGAFNADQFTKLNTFVVSSGNFGNLLSIKNTIDTINKSILNNGAVNEIQLRDRIVSPDDILTDNGFVKYLAQAYAYVHSSDNGLSTLGSNNNSYYKVSQNNFFKDRVSELNRDPETRANLKQVVYNQNSIVLQAVDGGQNLEVETFINFKDEESHDIGRDYFGITLREDYVAKMDFIFADRLISPTVADKKTYHTIKGIKLPHETVTFKKYPNGYVAMYGETSLDILLGYIHDEYNRVKLTIQQINDDDKNNPNWLSPEKRIKNYHTPNRYKGKDKKIHKIEGNGARFIYFNGIYAYFNNKELFLNFNDPRKSALENLKFAEDNFFSLPVERQKEFLSGIISKRVREEINTATKLGLIEINENGNIWSMRNKLLDDYVLAERKQRYQNYDSVNAEGFAIFDMISDYVIGSIISVTEIEKLFSGDPAYYKVLYSERGMIDNSVDKIKRLSALTSTGTNNRLDFFNAEMPIEYTVTEFADHEIRSNQWDELEGLFIKGNIKETILELEGEDAWNDVKSKSIQEIKEIYPEAVAMATKAAKADVSGYKDGINVADAAVYITPKMFKNLMRMQGMWSPEIKEAFEILTNEDTADQWQSDPKLYYKANKVVLNALKYMSFGTRYRDGLGIPYFNKMALFPLFKSIATGDLRLLYDRMTLPDNEIDMALFNSAVKAGSESPQSFYRVAKDSELDLKDGQTVLSAKMLDVLESGEGTIVSDLSLLHVYKQHFKDLRQQLLTDPHIHEEQMAGTLFVKVNLSNLRMDDFYGKNGDLVTGEYIKTTIMETINQLSDLGVQELKDQLLTESGEVNQTNVAKMLLEDAMESDANDNIISALNDAIKNGNFDEMPLSSMSDNKWLESRFISLINKKIIDIEIAGGAFIQRSAFGVKASSQKVITPNMINDGRSLKLINEEGSMDAVVSINLFKHIIPNYNKMTFSQAKKWLVDHNIIGDNATANTIGYRIPTQSVASISPLRFVDVFPEIMGDTIMLPEEFTKLTGSDFDIDKLYVARYQYNEDGNIITEGKEGLKNKLVQNYLRVLLTKENTASLKLSIDIATNNVKDVLSDIEGNIEKSIVSPLSVYSPTYQMEKKEEYTGGKAGIGPFALNNAHHILTQLTGLNMVENDFTRRIGIVNVHGIFDLPTAGQKRGGRILDWLSAMINAFVDIAKDPYIVRLNVNAWTYNMTSFLLRAGKGKQTFYFMSQPILKEMAEEVLKTKGKYGIDRTKTPTQLETEAIEKVLLKYDPTGNNRKKYERATKKTLLSEITFGDMFDTYLSKETGKESSILRDLIKHKDSISNFNEMQLKVYYTWVAIKPYADALANLVKYSKIDTKKTGKSFAAQQTYYAGMLEMCINPYFEEGAVEDFFKETFIETKTENSIPFGTMLFENLLLRNTKTFLNRKDIILKLLGRYTTANEKLLSSVINAAESQIKSEFFNEYLKNNNIDFKGMFVGKNTIANRLNNFKLRVEKGEFPDLFIDGKYLNDFLNYLLPNFNVEHNLSFVDVSELLSTDQTLDNNLINYWRELLQHPNERILKLFKDLAVYAFYTTGDNSAMNGFFKYLPNSYRKEIKYNTFISEIIQKYNSDTEMFLPLEDIFLNNWTNDALVKPIDMTLLQGDAYFDLKTLSLTPLDIIPNIIAGERSFMSGTAIRPLNWVKVVDELYPIFPPFVKIRIDGYNILNWHLYKLIGYTVKPKAYSTAVDYVPIYGLVNKKGYKRRGHTIYEYGKPTSFEFNTERVYNYAEIIKELESLLDYVQTTKNLDENVAQEWAEILRIGIESIYSLPSYKFLRDAKEHSLYENDFDFDNNEDTAMPLENALDPNDVYENTFGNQLTQSSIVQSTNNTDNSNILQQYLNNQETNVNWSRYSDNGYEVSSQGDIRFSALYATFKKGTVIEGVDVGGKTIEWVYQNVIKKSGKGKAPSKDSKLYNPSLTAKELQEDYSYSEGYLPLWQEWARQNPSLIEELREKSNGKTLTDKFASTRVSQARALAEILNNTKKQRPSEKC